MLLKVAWRNIWRNKKRSLIIIGAVTVGVSTGIFLMAFYNGMVEQRVRMAIQNEISHLQVHHPGFRKDYDIGYYISQGPATLQQIRSRETVQQAAGRIIIQGMIGSASGSSGITINGVMPEEENELTALKGKLLAGNYFDPSGRNEIIIGEKLMKKLNLSLRKKTILTFQDTSGNIVSAAFRITGVFKTSNAPYDESNVFVQIRDVDSLAGLQYQYNEIAVLLHAGNTLDATLAALKGSFPAAEIISWKDISPEIALTVSVADQMVFIFMGIILLAIAFGIINTMLMAILERTREIGMLLALGMNRARIFSMVLMETVLLVLAGCPGGIAISMTAIAITHRTGLSFKKFSDVYASFGYSEVIYPELALRQFTAILLLVVITALVSSLFPAWRALHLKPAEAMRK